MPDTKSSKSLKGEVLDLLDRWHPETVADLITMLQEKRGIKASKTALAEVLQELRREEDLELEDPNLHDTWLIGFLRNWELTRDYWVIIASLVILNLIIQLPSLTFLSPVRWGLGTLAVLLFPGYSIQMCLFPSKKQLPLWRRILLALGLSIAAVGFYAVILDATAQGIVLGSLLIIFTFHTLLLASIGLLRRYETSQALNQRHQEAARGLLTK